MVEDDVAVHREDEPLSHSGPLDGNLSVETLGTGDGIAQGDDGRHVDVCDVVAGLLALGDAHRILDLVTSRGGNDAAGDPFGHFGLHGPGLLGEEAFVTCGVGVLGERVGDPHRDMVFVHRRFAELRRGLLAVRRAGLPGELGASVPPLLSVLPSSLERASPEIQECSRRFGLRQEQRGHGE